MVEIKEDARYMVGDRQLVQFFLTIDGEELCGEDSQPELVLRAGAFDRLAAVIRRGQAKKRLRHII
jgi:hypothetical protein